MLYLLSFASTFIRNNKILTGIIIFAIISSFLNLRQCSKNQTLKKQVAVANHNIKALNDTIRLTKDKEGKDEFDKLALLTDKISKLAEMNADLAVEVKAIKGRVNTIIKTDLKIIHDTIPIPATGGVVDSVVRVDWKYDTTFSPGNYRKLNGFTTYDLKTKFPYAQKNQDEFGVRLVTGIKNLKEGKPEIFLKSDYPGFNVTALDGAVLDPSLFKPKKRTPFITIGGHIGYTPVTYDLVNRKVLFNFAQIGGSFGVNINFLRK
jgi:hypothetical protein